MRSQSPLPSKTKPTYDVGITPEEGAAKYGRCNVCNNIRWPGTAYLSQRWLVCKYHYIAEVNANRRMKDGACEALGLPTSKQREEAKAKANGRQKASVTAAKNVL
jgi:hypothetical protein